MEFKDYYKTLGVEAGAGQDEIKKAYRRLARKYHPDVSTEKDAEDRFKEVGEAYEVLRDPEKRKSYDELRASGYRAGQPGFQPPPGWSGHRQESGFDGSGFASDRTEGFSDFFESLFGRRGRASRPSRGTDLHAQVEIDLETAYAGGMQRVTLERPMVTPEGAIQRKRQSMDIRIPAGVTEGRQLRLRGKGDAGEGGAGDLYLDIHIRPHRQYELQGKDVYLDLPVAPWEAGLGARVRVPTLGGSVEMNIPEGASSGQQLRLKGRGLPGKPPGDQYVTLRIVMPRAETDRQRELLRDLKQEMDFDPRARLEVS